MMISSSALGTPACFYVSSGSFVDTKDTPSSFGTKWNVLAKHLLSVNLLSYTSNHSEHHLVLAAGLHTTVRSKIWRPEAVLWTFACRQTCCQKHHKLIGQLPWTTVKRLQSFLPGIYWSSLEGYGMPPETGKKQKGDTIVKIRFLQSWLEDIVIKRSGQEIPSSQAHSYHKNHVCFVHIFSCAGVQGFEVVSLLNSFACCHSSKNNELFLHVHMWAERCGDIWDILNSLKCVLDCVGLFQL